MDAFSLIDEEEKKRKKRLVSSVDEGNLLISDKKKSDDILNFAYSYKPPQEKREEVVAPQSQTSKQQSSIFQQIGGVLSRVWDGLKTGATQIVKTEKPQEVFSSFTKYQQDTIKKIQVNQKDKAEFYALSSAPVIFKRINEIDNKIKNEVVSDKKGFISNSIYKSLTEEKNKLNDLVNRGITDERAAYEMFKEAQNILKKRYQTGIAIGLTEAAKSTFIDSISWLAKDTPFISDKTQAASKKVDEWVNAVRPENSNFADSLSSGVGSALFFYIPGFGIAKGTSFLARVSPKLALFFGGSASAALEATAEAGSVYQENINAKKTKQESSKEADKTFYANLFLVGITNRFGMFSDKLKGLKRILISAPIEGLQEGFQQVIGNVNTGKDYMEGVLESGVIGTIIGAGLGSIDIVEDVKVKDKEVAKPVKADKEDTVPPVVKEAIEKVTDSKKEVSPLNVQGLDELTNKKIEELNTKDAENPIQEGYVRVYQAIEKGKETSYVFKTPQELAQYKNNTTSETEQFQYKDVRPEQLEAVEAKPGVFQIKEEKKKTSTLSATPADQLANSEASNLTREEFINKGIEEYKKSEEYLNASEDNKQWFISTERNLLAEHFTNVQRIKGESIKEEEKNREILRGTKGMTADDIMKTYPNIKLTKDVPAKDIYGNKVQIPEGEKLTPYELKGNKILLQDGETYIVSKNQFQNIKGNSIEASGKPFAPELDELESVTYGNNEKRIKEIESEFKKKNLSIEVEMGGDVFVLDPKVNEIIDSEYLEKKYPELFKLAAEYETLADGKSINSKKTKYSEYTLPGGENYKEILIKSIIPFDLVDKNTGKAIKTFENADKAREYLFKEISEKDRIFYQIKPNDRFGSNFKSAHWNDLNVVAHIRLNEREYKGDKVTFLEELQSDWAKDVRKNSVEKNIDKLNTVSKQLYSKEFNELPDTLKKQTIRDLRLEETPTSPYLKNWQELSIKKALIEALNNGSKYFSWINGEQTSARYNLSAYLDNVSWRSSKEGNNKSIEIKTSENRSIDFKTDGEGNIIQVLTPDDYNIKGKKIDEVLGKGLADKIMSGETGTLSGEGLKFGGEWATNLYDKQVKTIVEKITGAKVQTIDLKLPVEKETKRFYLVDEHNGQELIGSELTVEQLKVGKKIRTEQGDVFYITNVLEDGKFEAVPKKFYGTNLTGLDKDAFDQSKITFNLNGKRTLQQGIELTPEVKAKIKGEALKIETSGKMFEEVKQVSEKKQKEPAVVEKKEGPLKEFVKDKNLSRLAEYTSNKYINIKDLESRPALLYGGVSRNIFTDGFTMILDKKAAKKINDMALEKAEKRYVAKIKREIIKRDGKDPSKAELESMGKKYTKEKIEEYTAENKFPAVEKVIDGVNKVISEYKEADPMGYVPIGDDAVGVVFDGPQGNVVINGRFYRTLQEMFPKAKLYVYEKLRPAILKQGDVIKAIIMPINIAPETQALIKGRLGEQKGGSVGEQKSIYQREFSGKKVELVQGIQFPEMVRIVKEITGMTPKVKKKLGSALGKFYGKSGEIKLRADIFENPNDAAQVLAHEIGHMFDWMPDKTLKRGNLLGRIHSLNKFLKQTFGTSEIKNKEIRQELINLGIEWNPFTPGEDPTYTKYRLSPAELYADSISVLLNDPALLKEKAPKFWDLFFENLDKKPQVKQALFDTYDLLNKGEQAVLSQREEDIRSMFKKGEDGYAVKRAEAQKRKTDYLFRLKYDFLDKNQKVIDKVNKNIKEGKYIADEDNPKYWLEEQNYIGSVVKSWIEDKVAPIYTMFNENNISWEDFGEALFLDRVINERGKIANPLGFTPDTAQKQLDFLKKNMGEKKAEVLTKALKQFRDGVNMWLSKASDAGVYSSEIVSQLKANPSYATFQVIDYLDQYIPASIKKSVGTLKEIANPADATILKTIGLIRAIEKNTAKTKTVSFLKQSYSNEIMPAKTIWNGKTHIPVDPKEEGLALFTVLENGKLKGYYVDEYIAKAYEYGGATTTNVALNILKFLNRGFYKPLFTTFNLGFQSFNAVRDFMRFYKNIPDMSLWRAFIRYGQAVRPAFERSFTGVSNETIKEMERLKILGVTYNDIINERTNEDKQIEYMLQKYDILSKKEKTKLYKWPLKILDLIEKTGNFIEILPKVAGYKELNGKMPTKEMASFIRTSVGSPDFFRKGASYSWYNEVFLFANAIKEGIRADVSIATSPKTRGAFWMKTATVTFAPKILMFAALAGLFGDEMKKMFEKMSEYDKTNYTIVPMGTDQNGRVVYLRIPQDETGRFLGGLLWKSMRMTNNDESALKNMTDLFSFGAGQFPNLSPTINLIMGTAQFLAGQNPYDFFRGRNVIPDNEFKAGGKYALKPFALWMFQTLGGGVFLNTYITEQTPATKTWTQKLVELPVLSNIVGRWIKVSDYGTVEQARKLSQTADQQAAEQRIIKREAIKDAVKEFVSGKDKSAYKKAQTERGLVIEILGYKPKSGDTSGKAKERDIIKRFRIGVLQNKYDPYVDQLLYATSNDEKILYLKKIRETSSEYQFMKLKQELIKEKVISKEVLKKIK